MHTFFINTSAKEIDKYRVLFDIGYENRDLVPLRCSIDQWFDKDQGYLACADSMSEMIDMYDDLDNDFNLILFIDLSSVRCGSTHIKEGCHEAARSDALNMVFIRLVRKTLIDRLAQYERKPHEALIMFGTDKNGSMSKTSINKDYYDKIVEENLLRIIGIPDNDELLLLAKNANENKEGYTEFKAQLTGICTNAPVYSAAEAFPEDFDLLCREIMEDANVAGACHAFFVRALKQVFNKAETPIINLVACPINNSAETMNKSIHALNRINLACYILTCTYTNTTLETVEDGTSAPRPFREYTSKELSSLLKSKEMHFKKKAEELSKIEDAFEEVDLAPTLLQFSGSKFGLDEYGKRGIELIEEDVDTSRHQDNDKESTESIPEDIINNKRGLTVKDKKHRNLLENDGYTLFSDSVDFSEKPNGKTDADGYIKLAKKLRLHHIEFLDKLKINYVEILSHYSGKAEDNTPATLKKRRVSKADPQFDDDSKEYRYSDSKIPEERQLKTVKAISEQAYSSVVSDYLEFCAGRSLALTDIEKQCDWFITRVRRIQEGIKNIWKVGGALIGGLLLFLVPYLVIQWKAITASPASATTALINTACPLLLLIGFFAAAVSMYKKKYKKAWEQLVSKSDEALKRNMSAAEMYDKLLSSVIPSLRWVYDYKMDVEFYSDCCIHAKAKLNHHISKLKERVKSIGNMINDLECEMDKVEPLPENHSIDYNLAFCAGEKNKAFYTIIDQDFLNRDGKKRRKQA